jgi:uncharacterized protein YndB with AHSA1/START domain
MQNVEVTRTLPARPEQIWKVYTDHAGWTEWAGISHSSLFVEGKPDKNGTGAVRRLGTYGFYAHEEILEFEPPRRMTYRVVKGGLGMKNHLGEVLFEPDGDETRITWRCRFESKIPGFSRIMRGIVIRVFTDALNGLAHHCCPEDPAGPAKGPLKG